MRKASWQWPWKLIKSKIIVHVLKILHRSDLAWEQHAKWISTETKKRKPHNLLSRVQLIGDLTFQKSGTSAKKNVKNKTRRNRLKKQSYCTDISCPGQNKFEGCVRGRETNRKMTASLRTKLIQINWDGKSVMKKVNNYEKRTEFNIKSVWQIFASTRAVLITILAQSRPKLTVVEYQN